VYRRRKGEPKGFAWQDYRDLILAAHRNLSAPLVWVWDNLNIHLAPELADFAEENKAWLRVYRLPAYAPDMNPAEGIWSLLKRSIANFAAADVDGPGPHHQAQAEKDPVPAPPHRRLPGRHRPDNRALVIKWALRVQPGYLRRIGDVLEDKSHRGPLEHLGMLATVWLYWNNRQIKQLSYREIASDQIGCTVFTQFL
jgi:DDE superfamily endonuclease